VSGRATRPCGLSSGAPLRLGALIAWLAIITSAVSAGAQQRNPETDQLGRELDDLDGRIRYVRALLDEVEQDRRILYMSNDGGLVALSPDRVGNLYKSKLEEGSLQPENLEPALKALVQASRHLLAGFKDELERLEAEYATKRSRWLDAHWNRPATPRVPMGRGPEGRWRMTCSQGYPPEIRGVVTVLSVKTDRHFGFGLRLSDAPDHLFAVPNGPLRSDATAAGKEKWVRLNHYGDWTCHEPSRGAFCEGTLKWTARVRQIEPPSGPNLVGGVIHGEGELEFKDSVSTCSGTWSVP
jgi:hypothetical protein